MKKFVYNIIKLIVLLALVYCAFNWIVEKIDEYATELAWKKINQHVKVEPIPQFQPQIIIPDEYNSDDKQVSRGEWITEPCEYCNKTGYSLIDKEYWPHLAGERLTYWCDICKCKDYSHYHNRCPHCNGLGYNRRYVD